MRNLHRFLTLYLILFHGFVAFGQKNQIDSLRLLLSNNKKNDTSRVLLLNELAYLTLTRNVDELKAYGKQALEVSQKISYKKGEAEAFRMIGLGEMLIDDGSNVLENFQKSFSIFSEIHDYCGVINVMTNISQYEFLQGETEKSLKLLQESYALCKKHHYSIGEAQVLHDFGEIEIFKKNYAGAERYLDSSLKKSLKLHLDRIVIENYESLWDIFKIEGKKQLSNTSYTHAMDLSVKTGNTEKQIVLISKMANHLEENKKFNDAYSLYQKCISLSQKYGSSELLAKAYLNLAGLDTNLHEYKAGLFYYSQYMKIKNNLEIIARVRQTIQLHNKFETERKEKENSLLLKQTEKDKQVINKQYIGLFLLIAMIVILILNSQKLRKLNALKAQSLLELRMKNEVISTKNEIIEKQKQEQEKINLVKDKLFSVISHDMRAPLTQLKGILNLMEMKALDSDEWEELVPELKKNVNHSTEQLDNLLLWSKNQMQGFHPKMVDFKIFQLAEKSRYMLETASQQKKIKVLNKLDSELSVKGDKEMIQIVIRNLMSNAIKFTPKGGSVEILNTIQNTNCIIIVSDTGVGVKEEDQSRIFDELDYTTKGTAHEKGTGLGLKLAKDFIKMNNGKIWMESSSQGGSKFMFSIELSS